MKIILALLLQSRKDGVWTGDLYSGYSLPMEDPKEETNVYLGETWKYFIKVAYEANKSAFCGGEILAHLDRKEACMHAMMQSINRMLFDCYTSLSLNCRCDVLCECLSMNPERVFLKFVLFLLDN